MDNLVSIIIPAYNASTVIERCIKSIVSQDYKEKEIIIINDGSNDNTEEICERLSRIYPGIFFNSIRNKGVSNARNLGLSYATGKWIVFVDADDELEEGSYINLF